VFLIQDDKLEQAVNDVEESHGDELEKREFGLDDLSHEDMDIEGSCGDELEDCIMPDDVLILDADDVIDEDTAHETKKEDAKPTGITYVVLLGCVRCMRCRLL